MYGPDGETVVREMIGTNISVFDVDNPGELHEILNSLPLYPLMKIEVIALCRHPGARQPAEGSRP